MERLRHSGDRPKPERFRPRAQQPAGCPKHGNRSMRLIEYCDLGDAAEIRVRKIGEIALVSPNIVRVTYIVGVPGRTGDHVAAVHLIWDIADLRNDLGVIQQMAELIEQARLANDGFGADATAH
jgi:hypothetical protein